MDAQRHAAKVAIVTGAASGIGLATAVQLARGGTTVVASDVSSAGLDKHVTAFDLDPAVVALARRRLACYRPDRVSLLAAARRPSRRWRRRSMRSSTRDHSRHARLARSGRRDPASLGRWSYRTFLDHPSRDRFSAGQFVAEVERHGITVDCRVVERLVVDFVIGVPAAVGPTDRSGRADAPAEMAPAPGGVGSSQSSRLASGGDA